MLPTFTILMFVFQGIALGLLCFLGFRYRQNILSVLEPGSKTAWSRIFLLFLVSAFLTEALTWCQGYIKCLDTSGKLKFILGAQEAQEICDLWSGINRPLKHALFTIYEVCELVAVCSFQALVLERYRKVAHLFPDWTSRRALPIYTAAYIPIGVCAFITNLLEFYLSPSTLITRDATINTISSAFYCIWIVCTGLTDAILSFLIVSKVRRAKLDLYAEPEQDSQISEDTATTRFNKQEFKRLRQLQIFFLVIVAFDVCILSLTILKKINGHGIHGHAFAYEVASIEIACTIVHTTLTLCFMQFLGVILRKTQPQFEFVINSQKTTQRGQASHMTIEVNATSSTMSGMTEDLQEYHEAQKEEWRKFTVVTQTTELGSQPSSPAADSESHGEITIQDSKT